MFVVFFIDYHRNYNINLSMLFSQKYIIIRRIVEFTTIENLTTDVVKDGKDYFKIFHLTSGTGVLSVGLHLYFLHAGDVVLLYPCEMISWQTYNNTSGHFCLVHPGFFESEKDIILQFFRDYPHSDPTKAITQLSLEQSGIVNRSFRILMDEIQSNMNDKRQVISLQIQMILLQVLRAVQKPVNVKKTKEYKYIFGFVNPLLSSTRYHFGSASKPSNQE